MTVPKAIRHEDWVELTPPEKRRRTLAVADALFARDGFDVTMPAVASAIGIGVGSLYRQFPTKDDLLTQLMFERIATYRDLWSHAAVAPDAWPALRQTVLDVVQVGSEDQLTRQMLAAKLEDPLFVEQRDEIFALLQSATERAVEQGALRDDASPDDVRRIVRAAHEMSATDAAGARRLAELGLDGLEKR